MTHKLPRVQNVDSRIVHIQLSSHEGVVVTLCGTELPVSVVRRRDDLDETCKRCRWSAGKRRARGKAA